MYIAKGNRNVSIKSGKYTNGKIKPNIIKKIPCRISIKPPRMFVFIHTSEFLNVGGILTPTTPLIFFFFPK
jgi:hypothetical protein